MSWLSLGLKIGGALIGLDFVTKAFGADPDFNRAYMINTMTGRGGWLKTYFEDGLKSLFLGSRSASAAYSAGMPWAAGLYGSPFMAGSMYPYAGMNPAMAMAMPQYAMGMHPAAAMSAMPYNPMAMGAYMWRGF